MQLSQSIYNRGMNRSVTLWRAGLLFVALAIVLPVLVVMSSLAQPFGDVWQHLADTVLKDYVSNSLLLMLGVGFGTFMIGVSGAWLTSMCEFPGRRFFDWALLLPMAMPAYIIAYTYTGMLDFSGPVQTMLRDWFGWGYGDYWFPEIRSVGGAVCMLSLVLYPYVYLITRAAFLEQSTAVLEVSRSLGNGPWRTLCFVALPLARPAIVAGMSLALMETLADYGTVQYFGVNTFTTGIFRTWFGLGELQTAAQLSSLLLLFVFVLIVLERWSRLKMRYHHTSSRQKYLARVRLRGVRGAIAFAICFAAIAFGFILPCLQLSVWAIETWEYAFDGDFLKLVLHSFSLAVMASLCCLVVAVFLAYGKRINNGGFENISVRVSGMGYAIPGTVIAVGVIIPFAWFDNQLDAWMRSQFDISTGLLLSGTVVALVFAYVVRFLSVSLQTVESGLLKIKPTLDEAARSLGHTPAQVLTRVHFPMLRISMMTALILVFVDVLKELPATLILRPFNYNTLAVRAYELAADERLAESAFPALAIVLIGLVPVILLVKAMNLQYRE